MLDILFFIVLFPLAVITFTVIGICGAIVFEYIGDWVFERIADLQEWQFKED